METRLKKPRIVKQQPILDFDGDSGLGNLMSQARYEYECQKN